MIDRWFAAWNAHDADAIAACLTQDVVHEDPGAPKGLYRGHDAIPDFARMIFRAAPDFHLHEFERTRRG